MIKKWLIMALLICFPLKSLDFSESCPKEFVAGTIFGPAAVCAFYAFIVHPFLTDDDKQIKASTTLALGGAGLYGMAASIFLKDAPAITPEFIAGGCLSAALFAYWVNFKLVVLEKQNNKPSPIVSSYYTSYYY